MSYAALLSFLALLQTPPAGPVRWHFEAAAGPKDRVEVRLQATLEAGWHMYALELPRNDGPLPTVVRLHPGEGHKGTVELHEPKPVEEMDPNFGMVVRHHSGQPVFRVVTRRTTDQAFQLSGEVEYMLCNDRTCLPPVAVPFTLEVPAVTK